MNKRVRNTKLVSAILVMFFASVAYVNATWADTGVVKLQGASEISAFISSLTWDEPSGQTVIKNLRLLADSDPNQLWIVETTDTTPHPLIRVSAHVAVSRLMFFDKNGAQIYPIDSPLFTSTAADEEPNLRGICVILSAIHSVHEVLHLGKPKDAIDANGNFKREFLAYIKKATSDPSSPGVSQEDREAVYSTIAGQKIRCDNISIPRSDSGVPDINAWQADIATRLTESHQDCGLSMYVRGLEVGHSVNIIRTYDYSSSDANEANFDVVDTIEQGDGKGNNVSSAFNLQSWVIRKKAFSRNYVEGFNFKGKNKHIWNFYTPDKFLARCCYPDDSEDK